MGVLKVLVLCAVIFLALCEETKKPQDKYTTVIDLRCKRETEIDTYIRERKVNIPISRKSTKPMIPITKRIHPINAYTHHAIPRRNMLPVGIQPKVLNITKDEDNHPEVIDLNNGSNSNEDAKLDTITLSDSTTAVNLTTIDDKIKNNADEIKPEEVKERCDQMNSKSTTAEHDDEENKKGQTVRDQVEMLPEIVVKAELNIENDKQITKKLTDTDIDQTTVKEIKIPALNLVDNSLPNKLLGNFKIVPGIPIKRTRKPIKIKNLPKPTGIEKDNNLACPKIYNSTELSYNSNNNTDDAEVSDKFVPNIVPLTILTDVGKKVPVQITSILKPAMKTENESADTSSQRNVGKQMKMVIEKLDPDISVKLFEPEPEEIVIQNNNYEELYEASTPKYINPTRISSDLRSTNENNVNTLPSQYEKYNTPLAYYDNQYTYEVQKYPNQYVVNTYDNMDRKEYNNINDSLDPHISNQDTKAKCSYTKNASPWSQQYNQPQTKYDGEISAYDNYTQKQEYPKKIWRSWKSNQIFIRPKYGSALNTELYKGVGRYLANANAQSTPVYTSNRIGSSANENRNTSPYLNPFQYRRYGY